MTLKRLGTEAYTYTLVAHATVTCAVGVSIHLFAVDCKGRRGRRREKERERERKIARQAEIEKEVGCVFNKIFVVLEIISYNCKSNRCRIPWNKIY